MNNEENCYSVYKHTTPSNKVYIGITRQRPEKRWQYGYGYRRQRNIHFENAINKYGWENIKHEVLFDGLSEKEAKEKEVELITFYDSTNRDKGYNISPGGGAVSKKSIEKSIKTKEENGTLEKVRARMKALWEDPEWRNNHIEKIKGISRTEEQKKHYKEAMIKRYKENPMSDSTKNKLSISHQNLTGERSSRKRKVYQINPDDGSIIKEYVTARQAAIKVGAKPISVIATVCRGKEGYKNHFKKGYYWCYADEYDDFSKAIKLNPETEKGRIRISKRVMCVETGKVYESLTEAANDVGIKCENSITRQIYGEWKTAGGHTWAFVNDDGEPIVRKRQESNRTISDEHKKAVSDAHRKPVMCIETGKIFDSSIEAIKFVGLKESSAAMIRRQINGKIKTVRGYTWKYVEE